MMIFGSQEIGQDIVPAPADIAQLAPVVVIGRLAAHVDHAVDRGAAAEQLAARIDQGASVETWLRLGLHHPVGARIADAVQIADRDMHPVIVVAAACFQQQDARGGILRQTVGQHAAGCAAADDDVVVASVDHDATGAGDASSLHSGSTASVSRLQIA